MIWIHDASNELRGNQSAPSASNRATTSGGATMTITVLGATGKTGGTVAERLLAAGVKVKAIGRSADKLAALQKRGAQTIAADVDDAAALTEALRGSDAAYLMIPGDYTKPDLLGQYGRAAEAIDRAVRAAGVRRAVFLSSLGGERTAGTGPIAGLHGAEERLRAIGGLALLILRAGYFYENSYGTLGLIKHQGINGSAIQPGIPMPIHRRRRLRPRRGRGAPEIRFLGRGGAGAGPDHAIRRWPRSRACWGRRSGKPDLSYVRFPDEGHVAGLEGAGFAPDAARLFLEMATAFNKGLVATATRDREGQDRDVVRGVRRRVRSGVPRGTVTGDIRGRRRAPDRRPSR